MENKALTDMTLLPTVEPLEVGLSSSEKACTVPPTKPRKKSMTSLYLKYFETAPDGKSRRCIFCRQSYSIATATGPEIYRALMKVLQAFNIDKRILFCTNDGTQHAVYACHTLKEELDARNVPFCYIPCAARTLNLLIEDGLRSPKPILSKIREFALEMNSAPEIAQDFKQLTAIYREGLWKFPLDTSPSWNGDYTMLDIARKAPISMDSTLKKHEETFSTRNLSLNATEKSIVNILHSFLESFHKISTNLCTCKSPTIGLVLFFMDHVFEMIASCHDNYHQEWLKSVANDMVNRARSFTSQVYNLFTFIAAVLDPRIKKELIPDSLNSDDNLEEARIHFQRNYSTTLVPLVANGLGSHAAEEATVISFAEEIARKRRRGNVNVASDELSQYLSEPPLALATDVLDWWKANGCRYPCLSVMARDFLAVQGIAVEPEELFTNKGDEIRRHKFCLPYSSMQTVMCINEWAKGGFKLKYRSTEIDFDKLEFRSSEVDAVKP